MADPASGAGREASGITRAFIAKGQNAAGQFARGNQLSPDDPDVGLAGELRSVGELITDADLIARRLLAEAEPEDAAAMVRAWPRVLDSAGELMRAIPARSHAALEASDDPSGESSWEQAREMIRRPEATRAGASMRRRVAAVTGVGHHIISGPEFAPDRAAGYLWTTSETIAADVDASDWPAPGPGDQRLLELADNLDQARALIGRHRGPINTENAEVGADLEAARTRVLHVAWLATHAVGVATRGDSAAYVRVPGRGRRHDVAPSAAWTRRAEHVETSLGHAVKQRPIATALRTQYEPTPVGLPRLAEAIDAFGDAARRRLANNPTSAELHLIAGGHSVLAGAARVIVEAGLATGALQEHAGVRLNTAIGTSGHAWTDLARRWRELAAHTGPIDPGLQQTAGELRAACRERTHDRGGLAAPETIVERIEIPNTMAVLAYGFGAAAEIAESAKTPLIDPSDLQGPARAMDARSLHEIKAKRAAGLLAPEAILDGTSISADDKRLNRIVRAPAPVIEGLRDSTNNAATAADQLARAAEHVVPAGASWAGTAAAAAQEAARPPLNETVNRDMLARAEEAARLARAANPDPARSIVDRKVASSDAGADRRRPTEVQRDQPDRER